MGSLVMRDCLVYPYNNFKEKIKATKDIKNEITKRYGRNKKYSISDLDNCVMAEYKSDNTYF
jgi:hypothetical protein